MEYNHDAALDRAVEITHKLHAARLAMLSVESLPEPDRTTVRKHLKTNILALALILTDEILASWPSTTWTNSDEV